MLFQWESSYSINIPSIDEQHKYLVNTLNKVYEIAVDKREIDDIGEVLNELTAYIKKHFSYEKELFEIYNYPMKEEHIREHDKLTKKVFEFIKDYTIQKNVDIEEFFGFMVDWLQEHILVEDKRYSLFLIGKGVM